MPSRTPDAAGRRAIDAATSEEGDVGALNVAWSLAFVRALEAAGVREAVVSPGSRSAPLALAFDRSGIRIRIAIDERAGAYFALGLAKASRRPVAVLTTSGTAAANLHPAALEARHARVPLVLLTADRPPELRDTGAPQTIDQIRLFGEAALSFAEGGAPTPGEDGLRYIAALAARAVATAWGPPAGPAHVNLAFREPLLPEPDVLAALAATAGVGGPLDAIALPEGTPAAEEAVARAARLLRGRRRGLLVCGPDDGGPEFARAVVRLAEVTGYPVLADPLSGVRFGDHDRSRVRGAYDLFLRSSAFLDGESPEAIVQFGAPLTSKAYHLYAARHPDALRLAVDEAGAWRDPSRRLRDVLTGNAALTARALSDALAKGAEPLAGWGESFARAERLAVAAVERHLASAAALGEEGVFPALLGALPDGATVYVGNSMAVRDLDLSVAGSGARVRVLGNRGVSGIDGVVSSALGASAASEAPLAVVVGDLSFHHDLNALSLLREGAAATIVVVNNDGGGIFSFLPAARHGEVFERYFGTPHGLDVAKAAALYGVPYARCATAEELRARAAASLASRATVVLEVRSERTANRESHRALAEAVRLAVESA